MSSTHGADKKAPSGTIDGNCTMEKALQTIVNIFHQYVLRDDKDDLLTLRELRALLTTNAPIFLAACERNRPGYIEKLFNQSDLDKNKKLDFEETLRIWAMMAIDAHQISHNEDRCGPHKN